jgi:glycosyltransferase involved in cell wall biosynthesis
LCPETATPRRGELRILHVIASLAPRYGGPAKVAELAAALAAYGNRVEIVTTNIDGRGTLPGPVGVPMQRHGCTVTTFQVRLPRTTAYAPGLVRWLRLRVPEFDVAHVHGLYLFPTLAAAHYCRRFGVPYVMQPHGALDEYHRNHHRGRKALYEELFERRNLRRAAAVRWDSESERIQGERGGPAMRGFVIPPGIPLPERSELARWPRHPGTVAFVGRLSAKKGLEILVEAFGRVAAQRPEATLVIAGPDDERIGARLRERARALGIGERLSLRGPVYGEEKLQLLRQASVVVLPSAAESFGAAAFDALAAGTPVIVSSGVPQHAEIAAAPAGLVAERTPESLAPAILELLADPERIERLGGAGRRLAQGYNWEAIAARVEEMYLEVLAPAPAPLRLAPPASPRAEEVGGAV